MTVPAVAGSKAGAAGAAGVAGASSPPPPHAPAARMITETNAHNVRCRI